MFRSTLLLSLLLVSISTKAAIRVVDPNPANSAAYRSAQTAHDAAANGDTIYVVGAASSYGVLNTNKPLTWIGPGYLLDQNPGSQANLYPASFSQININDGSAGSAYMGLSSYNSGTVSFYVYDDNILIRRCRIQSYIYGIEVMNVHSIIIEQCIVELTQVNGSSNIVFLMGGAVNVVIRNSLIWSPDGAAINAFHGNGTVEVTNCVIRGDLSNSTPFTYKNNIIVERGWPIPGVSNFYFYNVFPNEAIPNGNGNQLYVDMNTVFSGSTHVEDRWRLSTTSPARFAGEDSVDCGMFGGVSAYVNSGLPPIPTVTSFLAPASCNTATGLPVTFRARGRN